MAVLFLLSLYADFKYKNAVETAERRIMKYELKGVKVILAEAGSLYTPERCNTPEAAVELLKNAYMFLDREQVCVVNLTAQNAPINYNVVSVGDLDASIVSIPNVFKSAILSNAKSILMMHNHPSGDPTPSRKDYQVTRRVAKAGNLLGIPLMDHVIVAGSSYYSFLEHAPELFAEGGGQNDGSKA